MAYRITKRPAETARRFSCGGGGYRTLLVNLLIFKVLLLLYEKWSPDKSLQIMMLLDLFRLVFFNRRYYLFKGRLAKASGNKLATYALRCVNHGVS